MKLNFKPILLAGLVACLANNAQAAYFSLVDHVVAGGYSVMTNGDPLSDSATNLSSPPNDVVLFGVNVLNTAVAGGLLEHGYAADSFLNLSNAGTSLSMSLSQFLGATATSQLSVASHQQDAFVDLSAVTLKIMGGAGEAVGSAVQVNFSGVAESVVGFGNTTTGGYLGLGLSVSRGNTDLLSFLWDVTQSDSQALNFSFSGVVGEELTLSSFMLSGVGIDNLSLAAAPVAYSLAESAASLNGNFAISAVPEPESFLLMLSGLGLLGLVSRRRNRLQVVGHIV